MITFKRINTKGFKHKYEVSCDIMEELADVRKALLNLNAKSVYK